jgi:hypothetical protein
MSGPQTRSKTRAPCEEVWAKGMPLKVTTDGFPIATALGATRVHGAGEVWKHGSLVTFNFLSGTFMEKWELPKDCPLETMQEFLKMKLKETFPYLVSAKEITFLPKGETFITQRYLGGEVTTEELIEWTDAGFKVCLHGFDPEKPKDRDRAHAQCKSTRAACQKPFEVLEEDRMKGGAHPNPTKAPARGRPTNVPV